MNIKITYIYHSSFCLETEDMTLLFDYYKGQIPKVSQDKPIYVFASHKHHDHFSLKIFDLALMYPDVTFVLSNDIKMNQAYLDRKQVPKEAREHIIYAKKNSDMLLNPDSPAPLAVKTLTSTDEGVAFWIERNGTSIYHAGDLNWWSWKGESQAEYDDMTRRFVSEMKKLEGKTCDLAFLPLDSRQEDRFYWGFDYFMKSVKTHYAFPMHMWDDYSVISHLLSMDLSIPYRNQVQTITCENQAFHLSI